MATKLQDFDYVQFCISDLNMVPRGKVIPRKYVQDVAKTGLEMWEGIALLGPNSEAPGAIESVCSTHGNNELRPCLETLTPVPWASQQGRSYGNVLCDIYFPDGSPDPTSPRQLLRLQVDALRQQHNLVVKTAFEYEFAVFKQGALDEPLGMNRVQYGNMRIWNQNEAIMADLKDTLAAIGVDLNTMMPEIRAGPWEVTTEPQEGLRGGDVAYYIKNTIKEFFPTRGYKATFMSRLDPDGMTNGLHLNHSLWTPGATPADDANAMLDRDAPDKLSPTCRHWIAGLLAHAPALTALCSPTLNCYHRMHTVFAPTISTWGVNNRNTAVRARNTRDNVFLEQRIVSAAANPYLALAGTVAAGMDGLDRKLECPPPMDAGRAVALPRTLDEALDALDKDDVMRKLLSDYFVDCYVKAKRDYEVKALREAHLNSVEERFAWDIEKYMEAI